MEAVEKQTLDAIAAWARTHEEVRRVWVIGTRAAGTARAGADLDVAVELVPVADSEETLPEWIAHADAWRAELQRRVRPKVDLEWVDADQGSEAIRSEAREGKILAYDREAPRAGL